MARTVVYCEGVTINRLYSGQPLRLKKVNMLSMGVGYNFPFVILFDLLHNEIQITRAKKLTVICKGAKLRVYPFAGL